MSLGGGEESDGWLEAKRRRERVRKGSASFFFMSFCLGGKSRQAYNKKFVLYF